MASSPTARWEVLHDRYYRKYEVYTLPWKVDFKRLMVRGAPFGGPVAVIRDDRKLLQYGRDTQTFISIYSSAGKLLSSSRWSRPGFVQMGWTDEEQLVVLTKDGTVSMYSLDGRVAKEFPLKIGSESRLGGVGSEGTVILDACIWGAGIALRTSANELYALSGFKEPFLARRLMSAGMTSAPTAMAVIEPQYTQSTTVEVLLAIQRADGSGGVLHVDAGGAVDKNVSGIQPFASIAVSPTGKLYACFAKNGMLYVFNSEFRKLTEFDTESRRTPTQLVWCGNDSVLMWWDNVMEEGGPPEYPLLMVGPLNQWIRYRYTTPIHLVPECDGVRVISEGKCEFIQKVPLVLEEIFKLGSTSPAAILYNAFQQYELKSPKSDDLLRSILQSGDSAILASAVDACVEAAEHQFDTLQRQLLKAASFGKAFLEFYNSDTFVDVCKRLRVLNNVRHWEIGIPLTYLEFKRLTPDVLVDRLIIRKQYLLALRICDYLSIPSTRVKVHWACERVLRASLKESQDQDEEVRDAIVSKLGTGGHVPYVQIARVAHRAHKQKLAVMLLEFEPRADAQLISLLFDMRYFELALSKAVDSGDTDLILATINRIQRQHLSKSEFFHLLQTRKAAALLFVKYFVKTQSPLVESFLYSIDRPQDTAFLFFRNSFAVKDLKKRMLELEKAKGFPSTKDWAFQRTCVVEQQRLVVVQNDLETDFGRRFLGLCVCDTISQLIKVSGAGLRRALSIKKEFAVPEKRYWYLMIRALSEKGEWETLYNFSREKKSPIGFEPFAEACIEQHAFSEAMRYISRVANQDRKIDLLEAAGHTKEAQELKQSRKT